MSHGITSKHLWPTSVLKIGIFRIISDIFRHSRRFQGYFRMSKLWSADCPKRTGKMAETRSEINDRRLYWNSNMSRLSEQQILSRARASSLENVRNLNFWWVILRPRYFNNSINCNCASNIFCNFTNTQFFIVMILNTFCVLSLNRGSDLNDVREILMDIHLSQFNYNKKTWSFSFTYLCMIICCLQISVLRQMPNVEVLSLRYSYNTIQLEFESVDIRGLELSENHFFFNAFVFV